jgi:hypothetical protein
MSANNADAQTRILRASFHISDAPAYIQERTYFDVITQTLEAVNSIRPATHSESQIEKALSGRFDMSRYAGFESKGFIVDDKS